MKRRLCSSGVLARSKGGSSGRTRVEVRQIILGRDREGKREGQGTLSGVPRKRRWGHCPMGPINALHQAENDPYATSHWDTYISPASDWVRGGPLGEGKFTSVKTSWRSKAKLTPRSSTPLQRTWESPEREPESHCYCCHSVPQESPLQFLRAMGFQGDSAGWTTHVTMHRDIHAASLPVRLQLVMHSHKLSPLRP